MAQSAEVPLIASFYRQATADYPVFKELITISVVSLSKEGK